MQKIIRRLKIMKIKILLTIAVLCIANSGYAAQKTITVGTSGSKASLDTNFGNAQDNFTDLYTNKADKINISFLAAGLSDMKIIDTTEATNGRNFVLDTVSPGDADDTLHVWSIDKLGSTFQPLIATQAVETTGTIQGKMLFNSYAEATTLTAANHNSSIVQMTVAAEVTMWDCETANVGDWVSLWARDAEKIEVVPASGDQFVLFAGTAIGANDELDIAATAGTKVTLICTADDTWSVYSETAASTDGGAAD